MTRLITHVTPTCWNKACRTVAMVISLLNDGEWTMQTVGACLACAQDDERLRSISSFHPIFSNVSQVFFSTRTCHWAFVRTLGLEGVPTSHFKQLQELFCGFSWRKHDVTLRREERQPQQTRQCSSERGLKSEAVVLPCIFTSIQCWTHIP